MAVSKATKPPEAPKPPDIKRRIAFNPTQAIGMPFILLIPVLGLAGLLDTTHTIVEKEENGYRVSVRYPVRFRHKVGEPMQITVTNETGGAVPKLEVKLSRKYLDAFENAQFIPDPQEIDAEHITFEFDHVNAGESRRIEFEMEASRSGSHHAEVQAGPAEGQGVSVGFRTFVLP
jgi:hypothetical protein